jgi:hypothetical protein
MESNDAAMQRRLSEILFSSYERHLRGNTHLVPYEMYLIWVDYLTSWGCILRKLNDTGEIGYVHLSSNIHDLRVSMPLEFAQRVLVLGEMPTHEVD